MPPTVELDAARQPRGARPRRRRRSVAAYVDLAGLGAGEYYADGARRLARATRVSRASTRRPSRCESPVARLTCHHACSAPTACAARRAATARSADRPPSRRGARPRAAARRPSRRSFSSAATRASRATWIEAELAHGACGEGASVTSAGVVPTPAVAYLTRTEGYDAGVVISASHNPFEDNGIKVFSGSGEKFTERVEREVEAIVADASWAARRGAAGEVAARRSRRRLPRSPARGAAARPPRRADSAGHRLRQRRDDDRGAASCSPASASRRSSIGEQPDGRNINLDCGSTHPERLARDVVERGCAHGRGVRRRRRPRDLRRPSRPDRRRRRRAADVRAAAAARRPAARPRDRRDRDEQHRPRARA